jgi:hypothetical protein
MKITCARHDYDGTGHIFRVIIELEKAEIERFKAAGGDLVGAFYLPDTCNLPGKMLFKVSTFDRPMVVTLLPSATAALKVNANEEAISYIKRVLEAYLH